MEKNSKYLIFTLISSLVLALTLYWAIDIAFGRLFPLKSYWSHKERLTHPSYIYEPYFSEEFLIESFTQPGGWVTPKKTILVFPKEFHGKYFNIDKIESFESFYRRTINGDGESNIKTEKIVLLIGGSTVYNSEVPDKYTIASLLSKNLNKYASKYFVINAGTTSINSTQELARLEYELSHGLKPNIVVILDGVNDIVQGVYYKNPQGVMFSSENITTWKKRILPYLPLNIYRRCRQNAIIKTPEHMKDVLYVNDLASKTKQVYINNILEIEKLKKIHHFDFFLFLQPNIYSGEYIEKMEDVELVKKIEKTRFPLIEVAFKIGYPKLREGVVELQNSGINVVDLNNVFNSKTYNIFLDFCHGNSIANQIIADAIAKVVLLKTVREKK